MKWLLPLVLFSLAGCVESGETNEQSAVDSVSEPLVCDPREILDQTLEYRGAEQSEMVYHRFTVEPGCSKIKFHLEEDSTWAGDVEVHVASPSDLEKHFFNGQGWGNQHTGYGANGQYTSSFLMDAEPGFWHVRAKGTGTFAFHVTGEIS